MTPRARTISAPAVLGLLLLTAAVLGPAYAMWPATPAQPPIIATVDFERVFNQCNGRAEAEGDLEQLAETFRKDAEALRDEAELLKQDLELLVPGTDQYEKAENAWKAKVLDYRAMIDFSKAKLDVVRAQARREIFKKIAAAAAEFAAANGIDLILTDDSGIDIQEGTDVQIVQQMLLRRVVFADPMLDVTEPVIEWINQP